ncbi:MAG: iron-sulfur cluster repair di-iron protein [Acidobacteria bacterium]|nr:iron-sulfur cluster repair di-iron protein [Acidobacteriota bacterium]
MNFAERKVGDLAAEIAGAPSIFDNYRIDYCCGGNKTLQQACRDAGVNLDQMVAELEKSGTRREGGQESVDWNMQSLSKLILHIVNRHHSLLKQELPRLRELTNKVCSVHAANHPELLQIQQLFTALKAELDQHLQKEEAILFPYVMLLEDAAQRNKLPPAAPFGTIQNPIGMMTLEHDHAGEALRALRTVSSDYAIPADGCASYRSLFEGLKAFERDLHQHIHLENNILFPRALQLEENAIGG